jgi:hypothetical protein
MANQTEKVNPSYDWRPIIHPDYGATFAQTSRSRVEIRWPKRELATPQDHVVIHNGRPVAKFQNLTSALERGTELLNGTR